MTKGTQGPFVFGMLKEGWGVFQSSLITEKQEKLRVITKGMATPGSELQFVALIKFSA